MNIEDAIGTAGLYYFYASFALISIFYCWFVIPETKGRSAKDMKRLYSKNESEDTKDGSNRYSGAMDFPKCCRRIRDTESLETLHTEDGSESKH